MNHHLFVYGTLHPDRAPEEIRDVVNKMLPIGSGTIAGTLHDLGEYPGLTLDGAKKQHVRGTVFALPDDPEILRQLDQYEGYFPSKPSKSLFIRAKRLITFDDGTRRLCWVYIYNRPAYGDRVSDRASSVIENS